MTDTDPTRLRDRLVGFESMRFPGGAASYRWGGLILTALAGPVPALAALLVAALPVASLFLMIGFGLAGSWNSCNPFLLGGRRRRGLRAWLPPRPRPGGYRVGPPRGVGSLGGPRRRVGRRCPRRDELDRRPGDGGRRARAPGDVRGPVRPRRSARLPDSCRVRSRRRPPPRPGRRHFPTTISGSRSETPGGRPGGTGRRPPRGAAERLPGGAELRLEAPSGYGEGSPISTAVRATARTRPRRRPSGRRRRARPTSRAEVG
jgi:hypothetical protein